MCRVLWEVRVSFYRSLHGERRHKNLHQLKLLAAFSFSAPAQRSP